MAATVQIHLTVVRFLAEQLHHDGRVLDDSVNKREVREGLDRLTDSPRPVPKIVGAPLLDGFVSPWKSGSRLRIWIDIRQPNAGKIGFAVRRPRSRPCQFRILVMDLQDHPVVANKVLRRSFKDDIQAYSFS